MTGEPSEESEEPSRFAAIEIETARLVLRVPQIDDAAAIAILAGDKAVAGMTARLPHPYAVSDALAFLRAQPALRAHGTALAFAIRRRNDPTLLGMVGLDVVHAQPGKAPTAEIGYWLGRLHWGQGYATEASRALIDHAFETTRIGAVTGACRVMNEASRRVLEKCGLHYVTSGLAPAPARGGAMPVDRFGLTRRDWESFKAWRPATVRTHSELEACL